VVEFLITSPRVEGCKGCNDTTKCLDTLIKTHFKKWNLNKVNDAIAHRTPKEVTEFTTRLDLNYGLLDFDLCPTCDGVIDRTYQAYCCQCGQQLKWIAMNKMRDKADRNQGP